MKAITLREPWASLVMLEAKRIETRSWAAPDWLSGQRIAVHAAKGLTASELAMVHEPEFEDAFAAANRSPYAGGGWCGPVADAFPDTRGKVIATAMLAVCRRFDADSLRKIAERYGADELAFGDFTPGRYGWVLNDVQRLPEPIPAKGALGLWDWEMPEGLVAA